MKFRRLYWVTEIVNEDGTSTITGVYTSLPDLIETGLRWMDQINGNGRFRLTLVQLDSPKLPLGSWISPDYDDISDDLEGYVEGNEFRKDDCVTLVDRLRNHQLAHAAS
ncbi:MAG: hypothetical protein ACK4XJ_04345 [Fimbriimonadaceae bacterium]